MAPTGFRARPIPSIIQGVSQQVAQQRRDAQCQEQFDCVNSPRLGVVARPGGDLISFRAGVTKTKPFTYELRRGLAEHYLMVLSNGTLEVYDLNTGNLCSVTNSLSDGYLASATGVADCDNFRCQTVGDYTFIINRSKTVAYTSASAPRRPPEAMVFFEAGNYLSTYTVTVNYGGTAYSYYYTTPDNSCAGNAPYIYTNQLAATFYRAMTGSSAASVTDGGTGGNMAGDPGGSSQTPSYAPSTSYTPSSMSTPAVGGGNCMVPGGGAAGYLTGVPGASSGTTLLLTSLGFSVMINGNLLRIWRASDNNPFTIDVSDGVGGSGVNAIQGSVMTLANLPKGGFDGFSVNVTGNSQATPSGGSSASLGYWVAYTGNMAGNGNWIECPAPGTVTNLDPATMPHQIFCSATNTFIAEQAAWMPRICGDGINTALDPGFVGKQIESISFYQGRLVIITQSTVDFSKTNQEYTFFPDTVQTILANGPISITVASSDSMALLRAAVSIDESFVLWAQLAQFRVNSGVQPFQPDTIQVPQSTAYEFNENCLPPFAKQGTSVYFSYEASGWATLLNLQYSQGRAQGDTDVTAHVPAYIPEGVRGINISAPLSTLIVRTDGAPNYLYVYNFLNEGSNVVQSAWNTWRLPQGTILWHGMYIQTLYVLLQRADGLALLSFPLNLAMCDAGQTDYLTRLDLRMTEANCTSTVYSSVTNQTTISWLHQVMSGENLMIAARATAGTVRGRLASIVSHTATSAVVTGDWSTQQFYIGNQITSVRHESTFYLRTASGVIPTESLKVKNYVLDYDNTGYSRIDIVQGSGQAKTEVLYPIPLGQSVPSLGSPPALGSGHMKITCDTEAKELTVIVTNDSHLPSRWTSTEWQFVSVERATPMLTPYGGPVA